VDSIETAHVADAIERTNASLETLSLADDLAGFGYDDAAAMAADMLGRFPAVRDAVAGYIAGTVTEAALDAAVGNAMVNF